MKKVTILERKILLDLKFVIAVEARLTKALADVRKRRAELLAELDRRSEARAASI